MSAQQQQPTTPTAETATSAYCGLDCSFLLEQLDFILDMIRLHSDYDKEFAPIMVQKLIDRCDEVKTELLLVGIKPVN